MRRSYRTVQELNTDTVVTQVHQEDPLQRARVAILAAKSAYQFQSDRWLPLLGEAVAAIEACPSHLQPHLIHSLQGSQRIQTKRPRLRALRKA